MTLLISLACNLLQALVNVVRCYYEHCPTCGAKIKKTAGLVSSPDVPLEYVEG